VNGKSPGQPSKLNDVQRQAIARMIESGQIEVEPEHLREVTGIGPVRAGRITAAWAEQKIVREIMVEKRVGLALAESQLTAIRLALMSKVLILTGGPGVGKTTIIKGILRIFAAKGVGLLLCAPTGRAAKRMTEATGFEAKTINSAAMNDE
jgi:hypothetical protein